MAETPLRNPAVAQGRRGPVALVLQDRLLHMLHQFIDGLDVGVASLRVLDLGLGGSELVSPGLHHLRLEGMAGSGANHPAHCTNKNI